MGNILPLTNRGTPTAGEVVRMLLSGRWVIHS